MSEKRIPAEVWPPCVFILEEMKERGWTIEDLTHHLRGKLGDAGQILWPVSEVVQLTEGKIEIVPAVAIALTRAFGSTPEYWLNLQRREFYETLEAALEAGVMPLIPDDQLEDEAGPGFALDMAAVRAAAKAQRNADMERVKPIIAAATKMMNLRNRINAGDICGIDAALAALGVEGKHGPENIGDIYLVHDYPHDGVSTYGVAYQAPRYWTEGSWALQMADGDVYEWPAGADVPIIMCSSVELVRRNALPI